MRPPAFHKSQTAPHSRHWVAASQYSFQELADIYNQSRVDYIVPMPMNARRMQDYVLHHDIALDASVVSLDDEGQVTGIGMLGLREQRAWVTRLGVIPERRTKGTGQFISETLLEQAYQRGAQSVQLEVIKGNEPAYQLFLKLGFQDMRELLVVRRPPGLPRTADFTLPIASAYPLTADEINECLQSREPGASWIEETPSILRAGGLKGLFVSLESGTSGWIVFQSTSFQLAHFVISAPSDNEIRGEVALALLYHVHQMYSAQDTKVENLAADDLPYWRAFQKLGYVEAFKRREMLLNLSY